MTGWIRNKLTTDADRPRQRRLTYLHRRPWPGQGHAHAEQPRTNLSQNTPLHGIHNHHTTSTPKPETPLYTRKGSDRANPQRTTPTDTETPTAQLLQKKTHQQRHTDTPLNLPLHTELRDAHPVLTHGPSTQPGVSKSRPTMH